MAHEHAASEHLLCLLIVQLNVAAVWRQSSTISDTTVASCCLQVCCCRCFLLVLDLFCLQYGELLCRIDFVVHVDLLMIGVGGLHIARPGNGQSLGHSIVISRRM